jgi:ABC-type lipoprotein release transport system permease subunit
MAALRIRFRTQLRGRWRAWLGLALLAGGLAGLVVGAAAGSVRTHGSYQRFLTSIHPADVYVDPFVGFGDDSFPLDAVAALPQVARSERNLHLAVISRSRSGRPIFPLGPHPVEWVMPSDGHPADTIDRLKVLRGRLPDPAHRNEVIGDSKALGSLGVTVGDAVTIRSITRRKLWTAGDSIHLTADPRTTHVGPLVTLHVVGEAANARADIDGGQMHLTPAFFTAYGGRQIGAFIEELVIRLRRGQRDLPAFRRDAARIAGKRQYLLFQPAQGHPKIQHSIDLQARALWIVTALGALAALLVVGQALFRLAATEARHDATLRALGMSAGQQLTFAATRAVTIALPATALTVLVAWLVSALTPIGWARDLEPATGLAFDATVIGVGAATVAVTLVAAAMLGVAFAWHGRPDGARERRGRPGGSAASRLARAASSPPLACGIRMALAGRARGPALATLGAATTAVVVTVTALTFGASFRHLLNTPALYGQTWDYEAFSGAPLGRAVARELVADHGVSAIAAGTDDSVEINGHETGARAMDDVKGRIAPTVIAGHAPHGPHEILLGTKTLDAVGAHIGGFVTVRGRARAERMRVVASGVLPSSKTNRLGYGASFSFRTLKRLTPSAVAGLDELRVGPGPAGRAAVAHLDRIFEGNAVIKPDEVGDFGRIDNMPLYIALLFAMGAGAALAHALASNVRRRRRDLAILKTLGFTRAQVAATVAWQATTIVAVAALIGVPLGVGIGRLLWNLFAQDLGVRPDAVVPFGLALLVIPGVVLFANAIAALPGWAAARVRPAAVLRTE